MAQLSGNSCNIITLLPLGIDCDTINATTPDSTNGYMAVLITGGTPPYNVTWSNGAQGTFITNLAPGDYTVTVVDYYGDFSATTTCTVGYDSFYLEKFKKCNTEPTPQYIYYLRSSPSLFTTNKIYKLTTQTDCWQSMGLDLYTNQTFINSVAIKSSGPFDTCTECSPPVPVIPVYQGPLCVGYGFFRSFLQETFYSGNTINGYPSWTSNTRTIYYDTITTRWTFSGWSDPNVPYLQNPNTPPTGNWIIPGDTFNQLLVSLGVCAAPPLQLNVNKSDPTCLPNLGSATLIANGGTVPYSYSLDNISFTPGNIFTNLPSGNYTAYVRDSSTPQQNASLGFQITPQQTATNYQLNVNFNSLQNISVGSNTKEGRQGTTFTIALTPLTPFNIPTTVKFDLIFEIERIATNTFFSNTLIEESITVEGSTNTNINTEIVTTPVETITNNSICEGEKIKTTYQITYPNCTMTNSTATITGEIEQGIFTECASRNECLLKGESKIIMYVKNISINPMTCQSINTATITNTAFLEMLGNICPVALSKGVA